MKYLLLMYQDKTFEDEWAAMSPDAQGELYAKFMAFDDQARATGAEILGGNELGLSHTATTVHRPILGIADYGDEFTVTDGPFAEVAEHLGGYYLIDARDLDHAIEVAKLLPSGTTEIRPIVEHEG